MFTLLIATALAGEIEVESNKPVRVVVDGVPLVWPDGKDLVRAIELAPGMHHVEATTLDGKRFVSRDIEVAATERVRLLYRKKGLRHLGTAQLETPIAPPAFEPLPPTDVVSPGVGLTVGLGKGEVVLAPATNGATTGNSGLSVPPPPVLIPMDAESFSSLLQKLGDGGPDEKLDRISAALGAGGLTCEQVGELTDRFDDAPDRVQLVQRLHPRIVDPGNHRVLDSHFDFSADRQKVQAIFAAD